MLRIGKKSLFCLVVYVVQPKLYLIHLPDKMKITAATNVLQSWRRFPSTLKIDPTINNIKAATGNNTATLLAPEDTEKSIKQAFYE